VLVHSFLEWDIIVFAPSTEGVEEEDGVLVSLLLELSAGVLEEEAVTIMEGVADLEGVASIGLFGLNSFLDLLGGESVLVHAVVPHNLAEEVHLSRDEPVLLVGDVVGHGVVGGEASESSGADLFLSVGEEAGVSNDSDGLATVDLGVAESDSFASGESVLELSGDVLGKGDGEHVAFAIFVRDGLHLERFDEFEFVHESSEGEGPTFSDGLDKLDLHIVDHELGESSSLGDFGLVGVNEGLDNTGLRVVTDDTFLDHVVNDDVFASFNGDFTSVDVEFTVLGFLVGIGDTGEVGDNTGSSLLVESLDITAFADFESSGDVALEELEASILVEVLGEVSVLGVGADESDEDNSSGHAEKLGDLRDSSDVLSAIFSREAESLVESGSDDITIEDEDFLVISKGGVQVVLDVFGESGFSSTGESSEPESSTSLCRVGSRGRF